MTTEQRNALAALVLDWARTAVLDAYAATLAVAHKPATLDKYLVRLLELRLAAEPPAWALEVPLWALDLSNATRTLRRRDAHEDAPAGPFIVHGRKATGTLRFAALDVLTQAGATPADFDLLATAIHSLDLEYHADDT